MINYTLETLHKKWSFSLRTSSVNVTKSEGNWGFGHIYWRKLLWKTSFLVQRELTLFQQKVKHQPTSPMHFGKRSPNKKLDWTNIYILPRNVIINSYLSNFQYKMSNNILYLDFFLIKLFYLYAYFVKLMKKLHPIWFLYLITCYSFLKNHIYWSRETCI